MQMYEKRINERDDWREKMLRKGGVLSLYGGVLSHFAAAYRFFVYLCNRNDNKVINKGNIL